MTPSFPTRRSSDLTATMRRSDDATMTMPRFTPLPPSRNLTEELAITLAERIRSGELAPAEKLPTEQEMIAAFGVSRTVVREAIAALRAEGLVESRQGAGVLARKSVV